MRSSNAVRDRTVIYSVLPKGTCPRLLVMSRRRMFSAWTETMNWRETCLLLGMEAYGLSVSSFSVDRRGIFHFKVSCQSQRVAPIKGAWNANQTTTLSASIILISLALIVFGRIFSNIPNNFYYRKSKDFASPSIAKYISFKTTKPIKIGV